MVPRRTTASSTGSATCCSRPPSTWWRRTARTCCARTCPGSETRISPSTSTTTPGPCGCLAAETTPAKTKTKAKPQGKSSGGQAGRLGPRPRDAGVPRQGTTLRRLREHVRPAAGRGRRGRGRHGSRRRARGDGAQEVGRGGGGDAGTEASRGGAGVSVHAPRRVERTTSNSVSGSPRCSLRLRVRQGAAGRSTRQFARSAGAPGWDGASRVTPPRFRR